jgi:hypothetical protein
MIAVSRVVRVSTAVTAVDAAAAAIARRAKPKPATSLTTVLPTMAAKAASRANAGSKAEIAAVIIAADAGGVVTGAAMAAKGISAQITVRPVVNSCQSPLGSTHFKASASAGAFFIPTLGRALLSLIDAHETDDCSVGKLRVIPSCFRLSLFPFAIIRAN